MENMERQPAVSAELAEKYGPQDCPIRSALAVLAEDKWRLVVLLEVGGVRRAQVRRTAPRRGRRPDEGTDEVAARARSGQPRESGSSGRYADARIVSPYGIGHQGRADSAPVAGLGAERSHGTAARRCSAAPRRPAVCGDFHLRHLRLRHSATAICRRLSSLIAERAQQSGSRKRTFRTD